MTHPARWSEGRVSVEEEEEEGRWNKKEVVFGENGVARRYKM